MSKVLIFIILLFGCATFSFSQTDRRVEEIRKIYQETNKKVTECEENGNTSTTFLTQMVVNQNGGSYPAVGIYKTVVKFYYTFGDREKNPYPNRLLKILVTTKRAALTEISEYLFDEQGQLIFYFEKKEDVERRVYFTLEKPIKILQDDKMLSLTKKNENIVIKPILAEKKKLVGVFQGSLNL